jgi:hypothetical protein
MLDPEIGKDFSSCILYLAFTSYLKIFLINPHSEGEGGGIEPFITIDIIEFNIFYPDISNLITPIFKKIFIPD